MFQVVIVDDEISEHFLLKKAIANCKAPCETISIYNGLQFMDFLLKREAYRGRSERTDLIFLDITMPLLDGIGVLKEMRKHPEFKRIPVYLFSSEADAELRAVCLELGAFEFVIKPADFTELCKKITPILARHCTTSVHK
ncbi:MAG: response regulator [Bacteroidetes bacterium]|nr:response regulator [Bacteroidota bacterium]